MNSTVSTLMVNLSISLNNSINFYSIPHFEAIIILRGYNIDLLCTPAELNLSH